MREFEDIFDLGKAAEIVEDEGAHDVAVDEINTSDHTKKREVILRNKGHLLKAEVERPHFDKSEVIMTRSAS
jgi:hypothetical protein